MEEYEDRIGKRIYDEQIGILECPECGKKLKVRLTLKLETSLENNQLKWKILTELLPTKGVENEDVDSKTRRRR